MYYVFQTYALTWRNRALQALPQGEIPDYEPDWWDAKPIRTKLPKFHFLFSSDKLFPDAYWTGAEFELYSSRLIKILREAGVKFETFSAEIRVKKKIDLPKQYKVFHLLELYPAIDQKLSHENLSSTNIGTSIQEMMFIEIRKLVLTKSCLRAKRPMFRIKELPNLVLIHETLRAKLDAEGFTGYKCVAVEDYKFSLHL